MKFETLEIDQCQNEDCQQKFTMDNIKLAVWLHGVILIRQGQQPTTGDPMLPLAPKPPIKIKGYIPKGYVGLTCPKCLKTSLYQGSYQDIPKFKEQLQNMVSLSGGDPNAKYKSLVHDLRYYAPYGIGSENYKRFDIPGYSFDGAEDDFEYFKSDLQIHIVEDITDDWEMFCSNISFQDVPAGSKTCIYWFQEDQIFEVLEFENENSERIFPRYHYMTELVRKIDALAKYNCESEDFKNNVKWQHEYQEKKRFEDYQKSLRDSKENEIQFKPIPFKDFLADKQKPILNLPNRTGDFLEVLISDPITLVDIANKPTESCNYLWSKINPFKGKDYPEVFPTDSDMGFKEEGLERHNEIVALVQEYSTKQYVQDFLKINLVDFMEEYEEAIQSNEFSYAHVWELKESYLEGLYKEVLKGLSDEAPYVMKKEGKAWKIVFNGKAMNGLRQIGFTYLYHLIRRPDEYFFHADLFIAAGKGMPISETENNVEYVDAKGAPVAIRMIDDKGLQILRHEIKKLKNGLSDAKEFGNKEKESMLDDKLKQAKKFYSQVYDKKRKRIRYIKDANAKKVTDSVGRAIKRALEDIQEENPEAYQHFSEAIGINNLYQDSLMYQPAPDEKVNWITTE